MNKKDIRLLVTIACNYQCYFCHHEGVAGASSLNDLSVDDYVFLCGQYMELNNWDGVTISGGEPLLYRHIDELIAKLAEQGHKITIVTNGYFLNNHLATLKYVDQINCSIHTLNDEMYEIITGQRDGLGKVKECLKQARLIYPNLKIRLNVTPTYSSKWEENFQALLEFAQTINASIKMTELFPKVDEDCISKEMLSDILVNKFNYTKLDKLQQRKLAFESKSGPNVFITQCTCAAAVDEQEVVPVEYCREFHELYVNHDGTIPLCRLTSKPIIDIREEVVLRNSEMLKMKIRVAERRMSCFKCNTLLRKKGLLK